MSLVPCTPDPISGTVLPALPRIETHENVLYHPVTRHGPDGDPAWGIYDRAGHLVDAAAYYRGPGKTPVGQSGWVDRGTIEAEDAPAPAYLYGGVLIDHFGHFTLSSIARCWPFLDDALRGSLAGHPILFHSDTGPKQWFARPYIAEIFAALGLPPERFVSFARPMRVRRLIVPRPSCEEQSFIHTVHTRLIRSVGTRLLGGPAPVRRGPVFLSRSRLPAATQAFDNQQELEDILASCGVPIAYPETLSMADQVRLFAGRQVVAGTIGSAFHTAAFCSAPPTLICLSPTPLVNPNFGMLDRAAGQDAQYLLVDSRHLGICMTDRVWSRFRITDPWDVARQLLALLQAICR